MKKGYSRLANVEEKRNIRRAYLYVFLSIVAVIFLVFLGLPTLIRFAGFLGDLGKSDKPVDSNDITPPAPPQIETNVEHTNKKEFTLKGTSESGALVTLTFNNEDQETIANSDGQFNFDIQLKKGENSLVVIAKDQAGNTSQPTNIYKVEFDDEAPDLKIDSPSDGTSFFW